MFDLREENFRFIYVISYFTRFSLFSNMLPKKKKDLELPTIQSITSQIFIIIITILI